MAFLRADVGNGVTPRDSRDSGGEWEERELRGLIFRALNGNVRHSSAFILAEIKIDPHSIPAPLTSTAKLSGGPSC